MSSRGNWQGVLTIARFNWPFYLAAVLVLLTALAGLIWWPPLGGKLVCGLVTLGALYFMVGSLGVSHLVYDRSDLYRWHWLERALAGTNLQRIIFCHAGFDEASATLRQRWPTAHWSLLDHFDPAQMTEPSIRRARALFPPMPGTLPAQFDTWPLPSGEANVVFGLLAIHEFRSETDRGAWFGEARRCLRAGGQIVLVEHLRDAANFLAFGPGFLHFHARASWQRAWERADLQLRDEFPITPFVRVFVLTTP